MDDIEINKEAELPAHMSFLEHLDELRKRLVRSVVIVVLAFVVCFYFSDTIFSFSRLDIKCGLRIQDIIIVDLCNSV